MSFLLWYSAVTGLVTATTLYSLWRNGHVRAHRPLCVILLISVASTVISLVTRWTPEWYLVMECCAALCAVGIALRAAQPDVRTLLWVMGIAALAVICHHLPRGEHWAYRGLTFVDMAAAMVLARTDLARVSSNLTRIAVRRFRAIFVLNTGYLAVFEWSLNGAAFVSGIASVTFCVSMLVIRHCSAVERPRPR